MFAACYECPLAHEGLISVSQAAAMRDLTVEGQTLSGGEGKKRRGSSFGEMVFGEKATGGEETNQNDPNEGWIQVLRTPKVR